MAGSRMEKLSTIFKRYSGLIKTGAVLSENRPIWYDVYEKFPPKLEPLAIRDEPTEPIQSVYYPEDILRAKFSRVYGDQAVVYDFFDSAKQRSHKNACETFIGKYLQIASSKVSSVEGETTTTTTGIDLNDPQLFAQTDEALRKEFGFKLRRRTSSINDQ